MREEQIYCDICKKTIKESSGLIRLSGIDKSKPEICFEDLCLRCKEAIKDLILNYSKKYGAFKSLINNLTNEDTRPF